jgi:hypothetical protein
MPACVFIELRWIYHIVCAGAGEPNAMPKDVREADENIVKAAAALTSCDDADSCVLAAAFGSLPLGKQLLESARSFSSKRQHLDGIDAMLREVAEMKGKLEPFTADSLSMDQVDKLIKCSALCRDFSLKHPADTSTVNPVRVKIAEFMDLAVILHVKHEFLPFVDVNATTLTSSGLLCAPPTYALRGFEKCTQALPTGFEKLVQAHDTFARLVFAVNGKDGGGGPEFLMSCT